MHKDSKEIFSLIRHVVSVLALQKLCYIFDLRDCPRAKIIWNAVHIPLRIQGSFLLDWNGWIHINIL